MNIHETAARLHSEAERDHWNKLAFTENIKFFMHRVGRAPKSKKELWDYIHGFEEAQDEVI